jgi:Protein of unknown function DUF58
MLTTESILKKVRELEIKSKKLTTNLFTGEYHSAFKGKGMSFREVREYHAGDDVRFIDWNVKYLKRSGNWLFIYWWISATVICLVPRGTGKKTW